MNAVMKNQGEHTGGHTVSRILRRRQPDPGLLDRYREVLPDLPARLAAARGIEPEILLASGDGPLPLEGAYSPMALPDMPIAAQRIAQAIRNHEPIVVLSDHDQDGIAAMTVLTISLMNLLGHPRNRLYLVNSHRLNEGYGMPQPVAERIATLLNEADSSAQRDPGLVITADCGSSDAARINWLLAEHSIETIVTDHHGTGENIESAIAFVNPKRINSVYPDPSIAGCMVAWLTMYAAVEAVYRGEPETIKSVREQAMGLLDYVSIGTIADCVDLGASRVNRVLVKRGLKAIDQGTRACWRQAGSWFRHPMGQGLTQAEDIAFQLAPRIASTGRLDEARPGVMFLLADSDDSAARWGGMLDEENKKRKAIQAELEVQAMEKAEAILAAEPTEFLLVDLPDGHAGVHGIVASRLSERFGLPAGVFSPRGEGDQIREWTGSLRGAERLDVRGCIMDLIEEMDWVKAGGGHVAAGGMTISADVDFTEFRAQVQPIARRHLLDERREDVGRVVIETDGPLPFSYASEQTVEQLRMLEPFGRGYAAPQFEAACRIEKVRKVGQDGAHLALNLVDRHGDRVRAMWFFAKETVQPGQYLQVVYRIQQSWFRGPQIGLIIEAARPIPTPQSSG